MLTDTRRVYIYTEDKKQVGHLSTLAGTDNVRNAYNITL